MTAPFSVLPATLFGPGAVDLVMLQAERQIDPSLVGASGLGILGDCRIVAMDRPLPACEISACALAARLSAIWD